MFGFTFHWGPPQHAGELRFLHGRMSWTHETSKSGAADCYFSRPLRGLYGLSRCFSDNRPWFFGIMTLGSQHNERQVVDPKSSFPPERFV